MPHLGRPDTQSESLASRPASPGPSGNPWARGRSDQHGCRLRPGDSDPTRIRLGFSRLESDSDSADSDPTRIQPTRIRLGFSRLGFSQVRVRGSAV